MDWTPSPGYEDNVVYQDMLRLQELLQQFQTPISFTAAEIGNAATTINIRDKFEGKQIWDSTNTRVLYSTGWAATDEWVTAVGGSGITPS